MESPNLSSVIDEVTVYRQGARVRRVATLKRENGQFPETVLLDGLPPCLQDDSLRIRIEPLQGHQSVPIASDLKVRWLIVPVHDT